MEVHSRITVIGFLCLSLFILSSVAWAYEIEGQIRLAPPWPKPNPIPVKKDVSHCGNTQTSHTLMLSSEGFIQNAVISLEGNGLSTIDQEFARTAAQPFLNQKDCHFEPHVLLVPRGEPFAIGNGDPMAHDVRVFQGSQMLFRFELDMGSSSVEKKLDEAGRFVIRCGLHPWMHAYVISMEHPFYAVSDSDGRFKLEGVPAGSYEVHIWHEELGDAEVPIVVSDSVADFSFTFPAVSSEN